MEDISSTIIPKSDQLNADDLIAGPRVITITNVKSATGDKGEKQIAVSFEGDDGKPYKPCKSMRRVMVWAWGPKSKAYIGQSLKIYRDPKVMFGGVAVGGIRISHMTGIDGEQEIALTETRGKRKPFRVSPLVMKSTKRPASDSPLQDDGRGDDGGSEGPPSLADDDEDVIGNVPSEGAKPKAWQDWGTLVRNAMEEAATTKHARLIALANRKGLEAVPSEKLRTWILEPVGGSMPESLDA